jgi:hypothetical protein
MVLQVVIYMLSAAGTALLSDSSGPAKMRGSPTIRFSRRGIGRIRREEQKECEEYEAQAARVRHRIDCAPEAGPKSTLLVRQDRDDMVGNRPKPTKRKCTRPSPISRLAPSRLHRNWT